MEKRTELEVKRIAEKHMGLDISRAQIRKFIQKYNDNKRPIGQVIDMIINNPSEFIELIYASPEIELRKYGKSKRTGQGNKASYTTTKG